eukprot:CAMPEP_0114551800 /NCGR_PEP_ID=MMETSP0114-20121206/6792_1 /TAXON_ID=31324 /ORGANISM="Goniomonas sp, Strain m" /LENGTH=76 /DNA_ID=CAMNT_0001736649 /DNA_START=1183 /DNA_END=1410 /DNA_ORIENTATION=+
MEADDVSWVPRQRLVDTAGSSPTNISTVKEAPGSKTAVTGDIKSSGQERAATRFVPNQQTNSSKAPRIGWGLSGVL